jgi:PAS domain S-box-containing protein
LPVDRPNQEPLHVSAEEYGRWIALRNVIGEAAACLISASPSEDAIPVVLERLGRAVGAAQVSLDQCRSASEGEVAIWQIARWRDPAAPHTDEEGPTGPVPLSESGLDPWLETLQRGDLIEGSTDDLGGRAGDTLRARHVRTFLGAGIIVQEQLTGFLVLGDCGEERAWTWLERIAIQFHARIIGSFLHRLESDRALRRSEERYRQIVESTSDYVWEADSTGRITFCSPQVQAVLGYRSEEVVGRTPFEFILPEARAPSMAAFRKAAAGREAFRVAEYRAISASGEIVWISTAGVPIFDESGALAGYRGTTSDITSRKRAESEVRASEERYRGLVESQRHLIVRWTPDFRLAYANEAYFRIFGYRREDVLGCPILDTAPRGAEEMIRKIIEDLSSPPFHVAHEQHAVTVRGRRWLSWESFPIRDEAGRIVEIQALGRDITDERTRAEELVRRDRILAAVNTLAERLLLTSDWETAVIEVLKLVGEATGAASVRILEVCTMKGGRRALAFRNSWEAPGFGGIDPDANGPFFLDDPMLSHLAPPTADTRSYNILASESPEALAGLLRRRRTVRFLAVPIFVDGAWWGLMNVTQSDEAIPWSSQEEQALRTACNILGAIIHRHRIRKALRESEEKYRTLVEGARQPIIMVGYTGVLHFANRFAAEKLGLPPEQMVGQTMWDLFPRAYADAHMQAIRQALDSDGPVISARHSMIKGQLGWYEARIQPLAGSWSGYPAALVIITDITERKETERRILEYQSRLRSLSSELAMAEQRERRRIASELHDRIGQSLAMARIKLGGALQDGSNAALEEVRELIDRSIQDTRTLTFELSPPILYELGLAPALEWLLERFESRHAFRTSFRSDGLPVELPPEILGIIFQCARELLVNVVKHARAREISVSLDRADGFLRVEVADDGIGSASLRASRRGHTTQGFGIFSIRERIEHLGGSFTIDSQPSKGTRARLCVPLRNPIRVTKRKER